MDDSELLAEFGRERSGMAFEEIVRRYTDLVYSAALRQMRNADEAEELTQAVFVILSQKAGSISSNMPLAGWLLTTTRFAAMNLRRAKIRRAHHERKAAVMEQQIEQLPASDAWKEVAPLLDAAMASLKTDQRNAVALRYFQGQPFAAVASRMGISEEAAKKRVTRGVEKLRKFFARSGVAVPSVGLTWTITNHAVHAAPMHLAASCSVAASKASASLGAELLRIMLMGKLKLIASGIAAVVAVGGVAVVTLHAVQARSQSSIPPVANGATTPPAVNFPQARGVTIHGLLVGPDGNPLVGVVVYGAGRANPVSIYPLPAGPPTVPVMFISPDGNVVRIVPFPVSRTAAPSTTTYQGGHFHLTINRTPATLVVNDDHGFAKVPVADFNPDDTIKLQAWSRVEGSINLKDRSGIDSQIYLANWQDFQNPAAFDVLEYSSAPIEADGHFEFPRVPPGPVWLYTKVASGQLGDYIGPSAFVQAAAGQTARVAIGDHGRTIKGRFVSPVGSAPISTWHDPRHGTNCILRTEMPDTMTHPSNWYRMNPLERASYREAWQQTPAAQGWNEALLPQSPVIQSDGSFQFVGVKPGRYHLEMLLSEYDRSSPFGDEMASLTTDVIVPDDANSQPVDLGDLAIKIEPMLKVKQPAPALTAQSLAPGGGAIQLGDYRGKYVLIHVWQVSQISPDAAHTVDMAALNAEFGSNGKIVLLGINHDSNVSAARDFVAANHLDEWVMASAPQLNGLPEEYQHVSGGAVLIGPDGNVIAKHLSGDQLVELLRSELGK